MKQFSSFFPRKAHPLGLVLALAGGFQAHAQNCTAPVTSVLTTTGVVGPNRCATKVGDPTIEGFDPAIAMANYLCRSIDMIELTKFNWQSTGYVYNGNARGGAALVYNPAATPSASSLTYNNTSLGPPGFPQYNFAAGACYHPSTYAKCIQLLVDLNARILTRVSSASFGMEAGFFDNLKDASGDYLKDADGNYIPRIDPGRNNESSYYYVCKQAVIDINAAYDTKGLRRPIIQAGVLENVAYGDAAAINTVNIDAEVLADFKDEIDYLPGPQAVRDYYDASSHPKFRLSHISKTGLNWDGAIDITKLEARMLMYQEATSFIRLGYKSLHMGMYWGYATGDTGYQLTYKLFDKIRAYARKRGTFVLLMGENAGNNGNTTPNSITNDNGTSATLTANGVRTPHLLFDFDGRVMRPREYFSGSLPPSGLSTDIPNYKGDAGENNYACSGPFNQPNGVQVAVPPTACSAVFEKAVIDPCVIENVGGSVGGESPLTRTLPDPNYLSPATYPGLSAPKNYEQVPYYVYYDFAEKAWSDNGLYDQVNPEDNSTYGYEDTKWFGQRISSACRSAWFTTYYTDRRKFHKGFGYVQIPGILIVKTPEVFYGPTPKPLSARPSIFTYSTSNLSPSGFPNLYPNNLPSSGDGKYVMANEGAAFINDIKAVLKPRPIDVSNILIEEVAYDMPCTACLEGPLRGLQATQVAYKYRISVKDPDVSSIYTIHVAGPNQWLPYTYGTTREIVTFDPGLNTIYVRQDNPGLNSVESGNNYTVEGVKQVSITTPFKAPICHAVCSNRALSTTENTKLDEITISPVPAKGVITVALQTAQAGQATLIVRNALGQVLKSQKLSVAAGANAARMDLSGQATGMYYLEVQRSTGSSFHKFLLE